MFIKYINEKGMGLVEVLAALGISVVVITSLVSLSLFTLRSSLESKLLLEGTKVANRELELIRAYRDGADVWVNTNIWPGVGMSEKAFLNEIYGCTQNNRCHMNSLNFVIAQGVGSSGSGAELVEWWFYATKTDGTPIALNDSGIQEVRISVAAKWTVGGQDKYARLYTDLTNWAGN